jgi:RNA polymerase sigma-70 factor (ECF subfamily)
VLESVDRGGLVESDAAGSPAEAGRLIAHFFRHQYGQLLARMLRRFGPARMDLCEEAIQEAMSRAVRLWPIRGIPDRPEAWLWRVAGNCAIDQLRREAREGGGARGRPYADLTVDLDADLDMDRYAAVGSSGSSGGPFDSFAAGGPNPGPGPAGSTTGQSGLEDEMLAMIFLCCHPAFSRAARAALTLKAVAGFGMAEIARAFLLPEATVAQRIVRAKRRIRAGEVGLEMPPPARLERRLDAVLDVIYLIFNEGYSRYGDRPEGQSVSEGKALPTSVQPSALPFGRELIDEALRLAEILARHPAGQAPQVDALRALMLLQSSRLDARLDATGALVPLARQDRARWDRARIEAGLRLLGRAARGGRLTSFHLLAGIAACHATASAAGETDWPRILAFYDDLLRASPTDVVIRINRTVALSMVRGPAAALAELEDIERAARARRYAQLPAVRADLLERLGRPEAARAAFARAAAVAPSSAARRALRQRAEG